MPIVYRPKIELGLCLLQPGIERRDIDIHVFTLITSLCAVAAIIIPSTGFLQDPRIAEIFYHASKRSLNLYRAEDLKHPTSTSIAIRYFHSGYRHAAGIRPRLWHDLEDAIRLMQAMRLYDEVSYRNMDYIESQLCRRLFWIIFTADKSAGILNNHPIALGGELFEGVKPAEYSKDLDDQPSFPTQELGGATLSILAGFNFNNDLWRAAYSVLAHIESLRNRFAHHETGDDQASNIPGLEDFSRLTELYITFEASLNSLHPSLGAYHTLSLSPSTFHFGQNTDGEPLPRALAVQRTNLHVSFQCLRLVIINAFASTNGQSRVLGSSALLLQKIGIAKEMLYIVHSSSLETLRLNGESCVEKIRLVGAAILELIDQHPQSPLASTARQYGNLYPYILAHLESKACDSLVEDT
ncbi:hypothetical protein OIDMADRAFT_137063 [Oidiodendron maius Zn]|uniref:Transcription factor domain-containing protein n=1 Tax=Oidiodendron maius (strain Zn) TaxID=913774 RepID=A0A0C3GR62_OIDMZ|nr:hypothetical protein OIDMADRAFT_137063 [Oidiodendron maius Zn]